MSSVVVAGVVSVRIACPVEEFPVPYARSRRRPGAVSVRLGSAGWTVARTLQSLGSTVEFATYVGADALGGLAAAGLREHGLYGPRTQVCAEQPRVAVLYDQHGRQASTRDTRGVGQLRYPTEVFDTALADCAVAALGTISFTRPLLAVARQRGVPVAVDLQLATDIASSPHQEWMRDTQVLACSHEELTGSATDWITQLWRRFGTPLVLVGCAGDGALLGVRATRQIWHVPASTPRGVRFVSGAGDKLFGAFLHHLAGGIDPVDAVRRAVLVAGWHVGATPDDEPGVPPELFHAYRLPDAELVRHA